MFLSIFIYNNLLTPLTLLTLGGESMSSASYTPLPKCVDRVGSTYLEEGCVLTSSMPSRDVEPKGLVIDSVNSVFCT